MGWTFYLLGGLLSVLCGCGERVAGTSAESAPDLSGLVGRWVRPDGGYVIEVKGIDANGIADVSYFNPRPINVGRSVASRDANGDTLLIELRDVNYPGSTYQLTLHPDSARLVGTYYQAVDQQTYDVYFERVQP